MSTDLKHPLISLVGGARGRLLDTVARVGRPFSIRQLADMSGSRAIVEEACSRLDIEMPPRIRASREIRTLEELRKGVLAVLDERRMKPDQDPWQTLLSLLEALRPAFGDRDLDAILADIRKTTAAN